MSAAAPTPEDLSACLAAVRETPPLVQCLTNVVVTGWTANSLLAAGAVPAMVDNPQEAGLFAQAADAVLVNLGTPQDTTVEAMRVAVSAAESSQTPWVLDPIAAGALPWRTQVALDLLAHRPAVVRGNASETLGLAGGAGGRGPDSSDSPDAAHDTATRLAREHGTVVAVSGPVDLLTDGDRVVRVSNGHEWLTRVTGIGCALGSLMAACAARCDDPLTAAATATALLTVAAEDAAATTEGPGSFAVTLLDRLYALEPAQLAHRVQLA